VKIVSLKAYLKIVVKSIVNLLFVVVTLALAGEKISIPAEAGVTKKRET